MNDENTAISVDGHHAVIDVRWQPSASVGEFDAIERLMIHVSGEITDLLAQWGVTEANVKLDMHVASHERLARELDKAGLLQSEHPDQMAQRSCTCEPSAICGAHRLLARYGQLFDEFQRANREKRDAKRKLRELEVLATEETS